MAREQFDFGELVDLTQDMSLEFTIPTQEDESKEKEKTTNKKAETTQDEFEFIDAGVQNELEIKPSDSNKGKEEVEDKTKGKSPLPKNTDDASDSFALTYARFQREEGFLPDFEDEELQKIIEEDGEAEAFRWIAQKQYEAAAEEAKKTYSSDRDELEEYFKLKDAGVDSEIAKELAYNKAKFESVKEDDLEADEDLRKAILRQHYKMTTSFNDARIAREIEKSFASGDDIEDAKEALTEVIKINKVQIEQEKAKVAEMEKQRIASINQYKEDMKKLIYDTTEIIKGQKINKQTQQKLEKMIFEPAVKDPNGNTLNAIWAERAKDPKMFDLKLAYLIHTGAFKGEIESVVAKAKTDAITQLEKALKKQGGAVGSGKSTPAQKGEDEDWMDIAKQMKLI